MQFHWVVVGSRRFSCSVSELITCYLRDPKICRAGKMIKTVSLFLPLRLLCDENAKYGPGPAKRNAKVCLQRRSDVQRGKFPRFIPCSSCISPVSSNMPLSTSVDKTRNSESDRLAITLHSLIPSFGDFDFLIFFSWYRTKNKNCLIPLSTIEKTNVSDISQKTLYIFSLPPFDPHTYRLGGPSSVPHMDKKR